MAEIVKKSVMAITKEVTEGTPVLPSASTQYAALQSGFSTTPDFEKLENAELKGSVGKSAPIIGTESPKASISHYIRHSHVEAVAPQFDPLIEAAIGLKVAASAEFVTVAGSTAGNSTTAAVINGAAGFGATQERGKANLIKDGTNGYSIRPTHSVLVDAVTLGFNLTAAPAVGVALGRAILYKPSDTPPTLTLSIFQGQGGAFELMSGGRVTEMSIEAKAKDLLKGSFTIDGTKYYFDPIEITASNRFMDFDDGATKSTSVAIGVYDNPNSLASALQAAMNSVSSGITVVYNNSGASAGKFTITKASGTLELEFLTGANTANTIATKIGFTTTDHTGFLTYTSENAQSWASPQTPAFDAGEPLIVKDNELFLGDFNDFGCSGTQSVTIKTANTVNKVSDICSTSGNGASILDTREVTAELVLTLSRHDADKFRRFKEGMTTRMLFNFGSKSGGNWVAGKCGCVYLPQCKISAFALGEVDGVVTINATLTAFVASDGLGEVYMNFV